MPERQCRLVLLGWHEASPIFQHIRSRNRALEENSIRSWVEYLSRCILPLHWTRVVQSLFCWVDLRHFLSSNTFEAEKELWKKILCEVGLNISPGASCHCTEPGWFRVCFANMSQATLQVAMRRIKDFVEHWSSSEIGNISNYQQNMYSLSRKLLSNWVRKLSSSADRDEQER